MWNKVFVIWSQWCDPTCEKPKNFMAIITYLVAISFMIWLLLNLKKSRKTVASPLPPGPRGLPIIGYLPFLDTHLHKIFTKLAGDYGPIYKLWLGNKLCVVVSSPSLIKELVRDQDTIFANREPLIAALVFTYGGNDIAWCSYGHEWKKMQKLFVNKMMSNASLYACYTLRKQEVYNII
ncbi:hypothetical protein QYF36_019844 [Acer negundo]|nr:hypothetical protein QYF36_019844 [Acer negundo]